MGAYSHQYCISLNAKTSNQGRDPGSHRPPEAALIVTLQDQFRPVQRNFGVVCLESRGICVTHGGIFDLGGIRLTKCFSPKAFRNPHLRFLFGVLYELERESMLMEFRIPSIQAARSRLGWFLKAAPHF